MRSSGPSTLMPAWSSCTSSRSTGTLRTSANWETVTSAIGYSTLRALLARFEPVSTRRHDELAGLVSLEPIDIRQIVHGLLRQLFPCAHAAACQGERKVRAHALEQQQVIGWHRLIEAFLARDCLSQQHVTRAIAQLFHDVLVELVDTGELGLRNVSDLLDRRETLLCEDRCNVLIHIQLLHEILNELLRL